MPRRVCSDRHETIFMRATDPALVTTASLLLISLGNPLDEDLKESDSFAGRPYGPPRLLDREADSDSYPFAEGLGFVCGRTREDYGRTREAAAGRTTVGLR